MLYPSEASCTSQIRTAKAVASEFDEEQVASSGVGAWAKITESNSERDTHHVIKEQGTSLNVPISEVDVQGQAVSWISPRSWMTFIVEHGLVYMLSGLRFEERGQIFEVWRHFWARYQSLHPHYSMFSDDDADYSHTIALYVHGDEGRTLKSQALMVTTLQSVLGMGFQEKRLKRPREGHRLHVNFAGHTFTTRFVVSAVHKDNYSSNPSFFQELMQKMAEELQELLNEGIRDPHTGDTWRFCVIGVKGDMPYLQKIGCLNRSWNTTVKRGEARKEPKGVCHLCLAGTIGYDCEEVSSQPRWEDTVGIREPWEARPAILRHLHFDLDNAGGFFRADVWHCIHLGTGKNFIASTLQLALKAVPATNNDDRLAWLTSHYRNWCKTVCVSPFITKISKYLISLNDASGAVGGWSKGSLTTQLMKWLVPLLEELPADEQGYLPRCREAARHLNAALSFLYEAPLFLEADECKFVSMHGMAFLQEYAALAADMYRMRMPHLFPLFPKIHAVHHVWWQISTDHACHNFSMNPLSASCQMDEDAIGRVSRTSRRVSARTTTLRTLQRYLITCKEVWEKAGLVL